MWSVCDSSVSLTIAATRLPSEPSSLATMSTLRTLSGPEPSTFTPSAAEYWIVVACGEIMVQPVAAEDDGGAHGERRDEARFHGSSQSWMTASLAF